MADLDFSGAGTPISGAPKAPDFASRGTPVEDVGPIEAALRGFVTGGGRLLQTGGALANAILPAPGESPIDQKFDPNATPIGAPLSTAGNEAVASQAIQPSERLGGLGSKVAFQGSELVPQLAAAIGTGGPASLESLAPAAIRSVPVLGRTIGAVLAGAPTATALNIEQAATAPDTTSGADLAKSAAINYALAGVPGAFGTSPLVRTVTGGVLGGGITAGQAALEGKPQDAANTIVGALAGAALAGGHAGPEPMDPFLRNYAENAPEAAAPAAPRGPLALPDFSAQGKPVEAKGEAPAPVAPAEAVVPQPSTPEQHAAVFNADPRAALDELDHPTLMQLADDAGIDVAPTEKRVSIISKLAGLPKQSLQDDVLPGYVEAASALQTAPSTPAEAPSSAPIAPSSQIAQALQPGAQVAVDSTGTAYTPEQGGNLLAEALQQRAQQLATPALPPAVTTVDAQGNAVDSGAFTRAIRDQEAQLQATQKAATDRANLGLTPDIERANAPRWQQQELANRQSAQDVLDRQATQDYAEPSELTTQRAEDVPPEPQWWEAGQRAQDAQDADLAQMQSDRQAMPTQARDEATQAISEMGIPITDHEEALATTQLLERAYDAGASVDQVRQAIDTDDSAEAAQSLRTLTDQLENSRADEVPPDEAQPAGDQAPDQGRAGAGAGQAVEGARPESAAASRAAVPGNGRERGGGGRVELTESTDGFGTPASWVIRNKETGEPVMETFERSTAERINHDKYEAVPVAQHLAEINTPGTKQYENRGDVKAGVWPPKSKSGRIEEGVEEGVQDSARPSDVLTAVPEGQRREDWAAPVEGRAVTALDDLVQRYGGSTLADSIRDDFRETTTAQLVGQMVKSPEDLAALASIYRNPAFETMRYVYVNRDGVVLGETAVSSRMPSSAVAFPTDHQGYDAGVQWIQDTKPSGTYGVWMIHNHPSGNPKPSQADLDYTGSMSIKLGDKAGAPRLLGHVVLDHDTFGNIDSLGDFKGIGRVRGKDGTADPLRQRRGDQEMFAVPVTSPQFAATTGKRIAAATPENSSAVVIMDAQGRVASVHTFPNDFLVTPRGAAMLSRIGGKRGAVGVGIVTSRDNFIQHKDAFAAAARKGLLRDATVVAPDGRTLSTGGTPVFPQEYRKNYGQQSAGGRRRNDTGARVYEEAPGTNLSLSAVRKALIERGDAPEKVAAMSPAELREEKANLRARSTPTEAQAEALKTTDEAGKVTSIKNATKEEERAMRGKAAVEHDLSTTNPEQYARAKERFDADPHAGQILAAKVVTDKKAIDPEDSILLALDAMRIQNARASAYEQAQEAMAKGDEATRVAALSLARQLDGQMEINDMASRYSGVRAGQILQARKVMIAQDYSMSRLLLRAKVAKGTDLTDAERATLEAKAAEIDKRTKELDAREAKLRAMEAEAKPAQQKKLAKAKFDDLVKQLKAIPQDKHLKEGCVV